MRELQHLGGAVVIDDGIAVALEELARSLADAGMSASVELRPGNERASIRMELGTNPSTGRTHILHARPVSGRGSHIGLEEL